MDQRADLVSDGKLCYVCATELPGGCLTCGASDAAESAAKPLPVSGVRIAKYGVNL